MSASGTDDVCLIVEGCYPYIRGGVSSWVDWLIRSQPHLTFRIVAIWPSRMDSPPCYDLPANVSGIEYLYLYEKNGRRIPTLRHPRGATDALADAVIDLIWNGEPDSLEQVSRTVQGLPLTRILRSPLAWDIVGRAYRRLVPHASFIDFYWAWRALAGGLFAVLKHPLPPARVYHAVSTGYAGLLAARAARETGGEALLTEHGIYTNERRIEILLADWIVDSVDRGLSIDTAKSDLRDLWIRAFESYSRICYRACSRIVTLYADNQLMQRDLGAPEDRLQVIANGIDVEAYAGLSRPHPGAPRTMAFIGRVAPIKDVVSFIRAAAAVRRDVPDLRALIMGPADEDPAYARECMRAVTDCGADDFVSFTGPVDVRAHLGSIHVVVLTSLSEAQPLVLLEAGAAGVPCVATDVGACREILEKPMPELPGCGPGGIVTPVVSPNDIAHAVSRILRDDDLRRRLGDDLRRRICARYRSDLARNSYRSLYDELIEVARARQAAIAPKESA